MKFLVIIFLAIISNCYLFAQSSSTITCFSYDDAGNRITRIIGPQSFRPPPPPNTEEEVFKDNIAGHEINIYPNPNRGYFEISVTNLKEGDLGKIEIFDFNGVKVFNMNYLTKDNQIDISDQVAGVYFLKIIIGEKQVIWKIIKE